MIRLNHVFRVSGQQSIADSSCAGKSLRTLPKCPSNLATFAFPLEPDGKTPERRQADVTFRLSLIAKLAGWELVFT